MFLRMSYPKGHLWASEIIIYHKYYSPENHTYLDDRIERFSLARGEIVASAEYNSVGPRLWSDGWGEKRFATAVRIGHPW